VNPAHIAQCGGRKLFVTGAMAALDDCQAARRWALNGHDSLNLTQLIALLRERDSDGRIKAWGNAGLDDAGDGGDRSRRP